MAIAFALACSTAVLVAVRLRYDGAALACASPITLAPGAWWWLIGAQGVAGLGLVLADRDRLRQPAARRALIELLAIFPPLFGTLWRFGPTGPRSALDLIIVAALLLLAAWLFWVDRAHWGEWGVSWDHFGAALGRLWGPTLLLSGVCVAGGLALGGRQPVGEVVLSLVGYPIYSLAQLLLFQVFLVQRLRRLGARPAAIVGVTASLFGLIHWPNGALMAACGIGAILWTTVYLRTPNVYALALSMGVLATGFKTLPDSVTQNTRVGPRYVQVLADSRAARALYLKSHSLVR